MIEMAQKKLESMSYKELLALQDRLQSALADKRESQRQSVRDEIENMAKAAGFRVDELFSSRKGKAPRAAPGIKYRHSDNASLTWTGRGRRPKWLVGAGGNIERFRVA
jgi:DNA-binding protein H-NS